MWDLTTERGLKSCLEDLKEAGREVISTKARHIINYWERQTLKANVTFEYHLNWSTINILTPCSYNFTASFVLRVYKLSLALALDSSLAALVIWVEHALSSDVAFFILCIQKIFFINLCYRIVALFVHSMLRNEIQHKWKVILLDMLNQHWILKYL